MKILVSNIEYDDHTREWNVTSENLLAYVDYKNNEKADQSIWSFGDFMEMGAELPSTFVIDVPYSNLWDHIGEIESYAKEYIKIQTSRDVKSLMLTEYK